MPIEKYLEKRSVQIIAVVGFLIALLIMQRYGAFLAYGVPGITIHTVEQTKPTTKSVSIISSYGEWVSYEYYGTAHAEDVNSVWRDWWGKEVDVALSVTVKIKVETSDLMLGEYLTEVELPPYLVSETENEYVYKNITVHAYAYTFKLTTSWSATAQVSVLKFKQWGVIPPGRPSKEDLVKMCVRDFLVPDFNRHFSTAAKMLLSIDAPTLAEDKERELRPDYIGIAGMWLMNYQTMGYTSGTAAEMLPNSIGTAVKLYRDKSLTSPCWAADYDRPLGKPLLTPDAIYWLDHFAPPSAWFSISIVNLGSKLVFDDTKPYPQYVSWAWEKYSEENKPPAVAQWFRVDLLFRVSKDWKAPKIPEYEPDPEIQEKIKIIVKQEPENQGTPLDIPPTAPAIPWREIMYLMLVFFGGLIAVIVIYYLAKGKLGGGKG